MLTSHVEDFVKGFEEFKRHSLEHWEEVALWQDQIPLAPLWNEYFRANSQGNLIYVTLRSKGELAGYAVCFKCTALNYASERVLEMNLWYVRKKFRGLLGGKILVKRVLKEAKIAKMNQVKTVSKIHKELDLHAGEFLDLMKFQRTEVVHDLNIWPSLLDGNRCGHIYFVACDDV